MPLLLLRARRDHFTVSTPHQLIAALRQVGPKPPPHPMILGTINGVTLRRLHGIEMMGRELTIPAPHEYWIDVPPERWNTIWNDALELAYQIESLCQMTARPHDISLIRVTAQDSHSSFTQHTPFVLDPCPNQPSPPSPALAP